MLIYRHRYFLTASSFRRRSNSSEAAAEESVAVYNASARDRDMQSRITDLLATKLGFCEFLLQIVGMYHFKQVINSLLSLPHFKVAMKQN